MKHRILLILTIICISLMTVTANAENLTGETVCGFTCAWELSLDEKYVAFTPLDPSMAGTIMAVSFYNSNGKMLSSGIGPITADASCRIGFAPFAATEEYTMKVFALSDAFCAAGKNDTYSFRTVLPKCDKRGYTIVSGENDFPTKICFMSEPLGHAYSDFEVVKEQTGIECGRKVRTCSVCGYLDSQPIYPDTELPILRLYGSLDGISKYSDVKLNAMFSGKGITFENYAQLKYQGHSSLPYDKKNYTLRLFKDELMTQKDKQLILDWHKENKFILKANATDSSQCRNLVCSDLWYEIASTRDGTKHIKNLFKYGAVDGFPTAVYLNDEFHGLFNLTLHKDNDLFDLDKDQMDALAVLNNGGTDASKFRAESEFINDGWENEDWEIEFSGDEALSGDDTWAKEKLNAFISFVINASDADFSDKKQLKQYVNIDSLIDYLIGMYSLGLTTSGTKNIVFVSYSNDPWICSMFDMENAFGLYDDGSGWYSADYFLPVFDGETWDSQTDSLLWDRLLNCYFDRISARYTQLREEILTEDNINGKVSAFLAGIPEAYYLADRALYPNLPTLSVSHEQQISEYIHERFILLDELLLQTEIINEPEAN